MKVKKMIWPCIMLAVSIFLLIGCGSQSGGKVKEFTFYYGDSNARPVDLFSTTVGKKVTELTGVTLKIEYCVGSDEETKAGVMIASGDYPDLINGHNVTSKFIEAGALVPLEDYINKYGTNIKKAYDKGDLKRLTQSDGHIYYLSPTRPFIDLLYPFMGFWLPAGVLKDIGYKKVTDFDEYIDIIRNYVKKNPTYNGKSTIGFTCVTDSWRIFIMQLAGSHLAGYPNDGGVIVDPKTYEAKIVETTEYTKRFLKTLNQLWNEGLVDKEIFSQNYDQYKAKLASGRVIGFVDHRWQMQDIIPVLEQQKLYDRVPIALPIVYNGTDRDRYMGPMEQGNSFGIAISTNCKNPVEAFEFLDKMCSEEIQKLVSWGIKDVDYSIVNGRYALATPEQIKLSEDPEYMDKQGIVRFWTFPHPAPANGNTFPDGTNYDRAQSPEVLNSKYKDYEKEILKAFKIKTFNELFAPPYRSPYGIGWDVNVPDDDPGKIAANQIVDTDKKYFPILVTCPVDQFETNWEKFVDAITKCKPEDFEKMRTEIYQQRVKDWSN